MVTVRELHNQAMALFNLAEERARQNPDDTTLTELYYKSCLKDSEAANQIEPKENSEPTRSILFISAASLALRAKELRLAEQLACDGLRGYPAPFHRRELHTLLEQATLQLHLEAQGQELDQAELQLSLSGETAGGGLIVAIDFERRLKTLDNLLKRVYMRLHKLPYVQDLRLKYYEWCADPYKLALEAPQAGSFAIKIRLIRPLMTPLKLTANLITPQAVINDIIEKMTLLQEGQIPVLEKNFNDDRYLTNFLSNAGELMPDGFNVNLVTLVSSTAKVALQKPKKDIKREIRTFNIERQPDKSSEKEEKEIFGTLDEARRGKQDITITSLEDDGHTEKETRVKIKEGLEDIVRSYFGMKVKITGYFEKSVFQAIDIEGCETDA